MIEFAAGVALGAAFSPFWMMVWNAVKVMYTTYVASKITPPK
jgi:hypothetical protein